MLSTFALILLEYSSWSMSEFEKPSFSATRRISLGVLSEAFPFPPQTAIPCMSDLAAFFSTYVSIVVTPARVE